MQIRLNGELREVEEALKLNTLLAKLQIQAKGIAIELNQSVILPDQWQTTSIQEGDSIEIVRFVGGGF